MPVSLTLERPIVSTKEIGMRLLGKALVRSLILWKPCWPFHIRKFYVGPALDMSAPFLILSFTDRLKGLL